jgi:hypothetical protein
MSIIPPGTQITDRQIRALLRSMDTEQLWHVLNIVWKESYRRLHLRRTAIRVNTPNPQEPHQKARQK